MKMGFSLGKKCIRCKYQRCAIQFPYSPPAFIYSIFVGVSQLSFSWPYFAGELGILAILNLVALPKAESTPLLCDERFLHRNYIS